MTGESREIEREGMLSDMETLRAEKRELHAEIERLKAALQPFAYEYVVLMQQQDGFPAWHSVKTRDLLNAHRALEPKP